MNNAIANQNAAKIEQAVDWMARNIQSLEYCAGQNVALYAKYQALWAQVDRLNGGTKDPCPGFGAFVSQQALREACEQLDAQANELNESEYIREQMEKVLAKFGYKTLTPVVLYDGKDIKHYDTNGKDFLSMAEDAQHALHVRIGQNGELMMKVAAASPSAARAIESGQPMLSKPTDTHSANVAVQKQRDFCREHPKMIEELEAAGIAVKTVCHNVMDKKFAICLHDASQPAEISPKQVEHQHTRLHERELKN